MKYSDSVKALLLSAIDEPAAVPEKYAKKPEKYQLVACDGSALDIFRNPHDPDTFFEPNSKFPKGYNQVYINACYSIMDRRFTDLIIQPGRKRNEYSAFCQMVDSAGRGGSVVYICDRGYVSYNNFAHVNIHLYAGGFNHF